MSPELEIFKNDTVSNSNLENTALLEALQSNSLEFWQCIYQNHLDVEKVNRILADQARHQPLIINNNS